MFSILLVVSSVLFTLDHVQAALDPTEMQQRLAAGAPILGTFNDDGSDMLKWMGSLSDDTLIESINIPGTHDACAWNYTGLGSRVINTQSLPIFDQLSAGIRFLDIRFGTDGSGIMIYHGDALLSDTVQLEDVLWGLYHFLDAYPTETIIASLKVDHGDMNDPVLQQTLHDQFTTPPTSDYWVQSEIPGTLGAARHKVILFRRYNFLPELSPIGINMSQNWADNNGDFVVDYAPSAQKSAFVEDLYQINGDNQLPATKVAVKFNAVTTHIENANAGTNQTQLFVSFASGYGSGVGDTLTPKALAVGDATNNVIGINQMILPWLQQRKGDRFGIVLFDFFNSEPGLVMAAIGLSVSNSSSNETGTAGGNPTNSGSQPTGTGTLSGSTLFVVPSIPFGLYLTATLVFIPMLSYL